MKLYYSPGACSLAVRIVIHELGLQCDYERVDLRTKVTEAGTDFLKINPKGAVPTLQLDNGEIITENQVIQQVNLVVHSRAGTVSDTGAIVARLRSQQGGIFSQASFDEVEKEGKK